MANAKLQFSYFISDASDFKGALPIGDSATDTPDEFGSNILIDATTTGATLNTSFMGTGSALILNNKSTSVDAWVVLRSNLFTATLADVDFTVGPPGTIVDGAAGSAFAGWPDSCYARVTACSEAANVATFRVQELEDDNTLMLAEEEVPTVLTAGTATVACDVESWLNLPFGRAMVIRNFRTADNVVLYTASSTAGISAGFWGT